ncbi:uncharacterized protein K460DRAFT_363223 [Cucurbitaria berberidis CBS 394.84]|uniref:2EXR domain-containing protein n=1 Tax=Cucurbitaria berberidis CBS 394.84 TaxID=1168544 RepID=A0A9P4GL72_9PLEO|nr:uncharacterized protein K460DRAFT_363223 [Cucurbitaria berberidis CBS 394.84]KAF1847121.1 hypothetical protein K460DRAFT_363223 [Cucurbitaria berberidis CBS 394.84]
MAIAYYYAAHFTKPTVHCAGWNPQPQTNNEPPAHHHSISTAPRHFVPTGYVDGQQESVFFRLPAELRHEIYKALLCPDVPKLKELAQSTHPAPTPEAVYPAILATCRKIHDEATDLLYKTHVFHAHSSLLTSLPHLISAASPIVCPSVISKIKRWQLTIRLDTDPCFNMDQATAAFSGAEYLEIRAWQTMFDGCDASFLRLFTGVRGVKVAKVGGSANPELARWLEERMMQPIEQKDEKVACLCKAERGEGCGRCYKAADVGPVEHEWFGGKDVWTFGNR